MHARSLTYDLHMHNAFHFVPNTSLNVGDTRARASLSSVTRICFTLILDTLYKRINNVYELYIICDISIDKTDCASRECVCPGGLCMVRTILWSARARAPNDEDNDNDIHDDDDDVKDRSARSS